MNWILFALLASVFIGSNTVITKKVLFKEHAMEFLAVSAVFGLLLVSPLVFYIKLLSLNIIGLILLKSFFAANFFYLSNRALRHMNISSFAPLTNLSPLILIGLGYFFIGERLSAVQIGGVFLVVSGAYILELKDGLKDLKEPFSEFFHNKYLHIFILGIVFGALAAMMDRIILKSVSLVDFYFYQRIFIDILIFGYLFIFFDGYKGLKKGFKISGKWIFLATVLFLLGDFFYFKAVTYPAAFIALVIAVKRLSSLFATFAGGEIFHEDSLFRKGLACVIMIAGVFLIVI